MPFVRIAAVSDLWEGEMASRAANGTKVLLVRFGDDVCAYEDRCAHLGMPLSEGRLDGTVITCGAHDYQYDARTGRGINPASVCLTRFAVRLEQGDVLVDVHAAEAAPVP